MKKLLIIAIVALLAVPAMADPGWFITGPIKTECEIPVYMEVPFFFTIVEQPDELWLHQDEGTPDWIGEETWKFINNTAVTLTATLDPTGEVGADDYLVAIKGKTSYTPLTTSAVYAALVDPFPPNEATIMVKLTNVAYFNLGVKHVANLTVTISE